MTPIPETCPKCGAAKKVRVPMHGGPDVFDCGGQWFFGSGYFEPAPLCLARQEIAALKAKLNATEEGAYHAHANYEIQMERAENAEKEIEKAKEDRLDELNLLESRWSMTAHELARERDEARKVAREAAQGLRRLAEFAHPRYGRSDEATLAIKFLDNLPDWAKKLHIAERG